MTEYEKRIKDKNFQNWLKAGLAISIARKGILEFVTTEISNFHNDILKKSLTSEQFQNENFCEGCTVDKIVPNQRRPYPKQRNLPTCPNLICNKIRDIIFSNHAFGIPSWKYTRTEQWCKSSWNVAKCYLPPDGYDKARSIEETDFNGILSIIQNCMSIQTAYGSDEACIKKARSVSSIVRHSPDLALTKEELNGYLDSLIGFLSSEALTEMESKRTAVENIEKLRTNDLELTTDDIRNVLTEELQACLETSKTQCIKEIVEVIETLQSTKSKSIEQIMTAKTEVISQIIEAVETIERKTDEMKTDLKYNSLKTKLKEDLLTFNRKHHCTIPLSPLFEKRDTPLQNIYVEPELFTVEYPLTKTRRSDIKRKISTLHDIFGIKRCNEIYVTSKAGMGKTVFCKRVAFTWCQAHGTCNEESQYTSEADLGAMRQFAFLFLIPLRNTLSQSLCEIDDMVQSQVLKYLSRSESYNKQFLQDILTNESCLVILDGLDEWSHSDRKRTCKTVNDIPHRNARDRCTILTTTRTWKFCSLSLSTNEIDLHVQILGLDDTAVKQLISNTNRHLGKENTENAVTKSTLDFSKKLNEKYINKLKTIPLILTFLICLWHEKRTVGKSYCNIFMNIIELLLLRTNIRSSNAKSEVYSPRAKRRKTDLPHFFQDSNFPYCGRYYELLTSLGHLAFETYLSRNREFSLVFGADLARQLLKDDFDFCLSAGFITQSRGPEEQLKESELKVSFTHKTFQEFFAALHVYRLNDSVIDKIYQICSSVEGILSVSEFYIFLCGISSPMANKLSSAFSDVIARSDIVSEYRSDTGSWNYFVGYNETLKKLQTLFVDCVIENRENNLQPIQFKMEDFIIDHDFQHSSILKSLMEENKEFVKSVKIRDVKTREKFQNIAQLLGINKPTSLEKIDLKCELDENNLEKILQGAENTLKCFIIKGGRWLGNLWSHTYIKLSNKSIQLIWSMKHLEEIYLRNLEMTHKQFVRLTAYVNERTTLKHIGLGFVRCRDHGENCSGVQLNLLKHTQLKMLEIGSIPLSNIKINTTSLEVCYVGDFKASNVLYTIFDTLTKATQLHVFCCGFLTSQGDKNKLLESIPLMTNLQHVWLINMDLRNNKFNLCSDMLKIKSFTMIGVDLSCLSLRSLTETVMNLKKTVLVGLYNCDVKPSQEFELEKSKIKNCKSLHVVQDDPNCQKELIFRTIAEPTNGSSQQCDLCGD